MKKLLLVFPFFILAAAIIIMMIPRRSPIEKAFDGAIDAANAHDFARFSTYVDVNGLVKSYEKIAAAWGGNTNLPGNDSDYNNEIENRIRYFIETERIPDPDRFRRLISHRISGENAVATLALDLKHYAVICTTSVMLHSMDKTKWQITGIDLSRVWERVRNSSGDGSRSSLPGQMEELTPSRMIRDIVFDPGR